MDATSSIDIKATSAFYLTIDRQVAIDGDGSAYKRIPIITVEMKIGFVGYDDGGVVAKADAVIDVTA